MKPLKNWDDVDCALRRMGELEAQIAEREAYLTKAVNELRQKGEPRIRPLKDELCGLLEQVEGFATENRADFGEKKSRELTFGKVGFRESTKLLVPNEQATIAALRERALAHCVRTKTIVEVDRSVLKGLEPEVLQAVGAERRVQETFFAEARREVVRAA